MDAWLFHYLCEMGEESKATSAALYDAYKHFVETEFPDMKQSQVLTQHKLTSRLKDKFGTDKGFMKVNNLYYINRSELRQQFAEDILNAPKMNWDEFTDTMQVDNLEGE